MAATSRKNGVARFKQVLLLSFYYAKRSIPQSSKWKGGWLKKKQEIGTLNLLNNELKTQVPVAYIFWRD